MADTLASSLAPLDQLASYAQDVPGYAEDVKKTLDQAGLGNTDAGKALTAGAKGALAGIGTGAGVAATVATTAAATGILATGAVALQAIPIAGTIAGAVLGLIAGLTAFFTGKAAATRTKLLEHEKAFLDYGQHYFDAVAQLPTQELRDTAKQYGYDAQAQADKEWFAKHPGKDVELKDRRERFKDFEYWDMVLAQYQKVPDKAKALMVSWVAEQAAEKKSTFRKRIAIGTALALGLGYGLYSWEKQRRP